MPDRLYVGIDDTDTMETPGTNKLALYLCKQMSDVADARLVTRHQLLEDPRVPCTNKNGCAAIEFLTKPHFELASFIDALRNLIVPWCPQGSDPGLCVASESSAEKLTTFGQDCQRRMMTQAEAFETANNAGCFLAGLGGTNDGVIGAVSAVGLQRGGNDGRVIFAGADKGDLCEMTGIWSVAQLIARGISAVRNVNDGSAIHSGQIELGKRLRANYRDRQLVLFVDHCLDGSTDWTAVRVT